LIRGKPWLQLSRSNVLGVAIVLGLLSFALMNGAYGQVFTNNQGSNNNAPSTPSLTSQQSPKLHLVKIKSPMKGEQVPIGKDLVISGTSEDNATTTPDCKVSVKLNGNSYRDASASGSGGQTDYSNWNFTLMPSYANMMKGQNKITAKFSCINNPDLISHNSVNVTGIAATSVATNNDNGSSLQDQISSAPTTPAGSAGGLNPAINSTAPVYSESTANNSNGNNLKNLSVTVHLDKNSLHPGDKQSLTLDVVDKNSTAGVSGALISGKIAGPSGVVKKVEGTTDDNGEASYSWKLNSYDPTGKYNVKIEVSNPGYENYSGSKSFKVTPVPVTISNDNSIQQSDSSFTLRHSAESDSNTGENHHHHTRHTTHSTIISSFSPNTITNTNTDTKAIIHISPSLAPGANANAGSDTNGLDQTSPATPSSSSDNTAVNTDSSSNQLASSKIVGERSNEVGSDSLGGSGSSANLGNNLGLQTDGLAQKIIDDVKNKLERNGIPIR
jgi:hypothetical protein